MSPRGRPSRTSIHQRLADDVAELRARFGGLPSPDEAAGTWSEIWYGEAHNSTAVEGNTLVLKEVEVLLREGRAIGEKQLKDYLEVQGYAEAARWVYGQAMARGVEEMGRLLSVQEVRHVHSLAMTPVWEVAPHPDAFDAESPGNWRRHDIRPFPGGMTPPEFTEVPALMADWVGSVDAIPRDSAAIAEAVAKRHAAFERIHPFLDGNGRAGRLLTNLILVRLGYPPAIVQKRERVRYLRALQRADRGDPGPLGELLARAVVDNLVRFIIPVVAGPNGLVPLEALSRAGLSVRALRAAVSRGRLRAVKTESGRWLSNKQWLDSYLASRYGSLREPRRSPAGDAGPT